MNFQKAGEKGPKPRMTGDEKAALSCRPHHVLRHPAALSSA